MKILFDENLWPSVPPILTKVFEKDERFSFHWIEDKPFHRGMADSDIFKIIREEGDWCILSRDKFKGYHLSIIAKDTLVIRVHKDWDKLTFPEKCWKFIKTFIIQKLESKPLGHIYILSDACHLTQTKK